MNKTATVLASIALLLSVATAGYTFYNERMLPQAVASVTPTPEYMLIVTGNHYTKTEDFGSMEKCSEAATYFSAGSAGQLMANCVSKR